MWKRLGYVLAMAAPVLFSAFSIVAFVILSYQGDVESTRYLQWWVFTGVMLSIAVHKICVWIGQGKS